MVPQPPSKTAPRLHKFSPAPEAPAPSTAQEEVNAAPQQPLTNAREPLSAVGAGGASGGGGGPAAVSAPMPATTAAEPEAEVVEEDLHLGCFWGEYDRLLQQREPKILFPWWFYRKVCMVICSCSCALLFALLGIIMLAAGGGLYETSVEYTYNDTSKVIDVAEDMSGPTFFYYEVPEFYSNHKSFVQSKDTAVSGGFMSTPKCDGAEELSDVTWRRKDDTHFSNIISNNSDGFRPCGLIALTMFTDTFELENSADETMVTLNEADIALSDEDTFWEKRLPKDGGRTKVARHDKNGWVYDGNFYEHFKVWYRVPASPHVRHLWAVIDDGLKAGEYVLRIPYQSSVWTENWKVPHKKVTLAKMGPLGSAGACSFLGIVCIVFAIIQAVMFVVFLVVPAK